MKLSILILTIPRRYALFGRLQAELWGQMLPYEGIQLLKNDNPVETIGKKRNDLLDKAEGEYLCFIDDDDWISENYIKRLMEAVESGCDCASLKGMYSINGKEDGIFEHSIKYKEWKTNQDTCGVENPYIKYERYPNHLNLIKSSIAKQFKFPEKMHGEDYDWSTLVHKSGLIKTEHYIDEVIYFYNYLINKNVIGNI